MSGRQKPRRGLLTRTSRVSRHLESQTQETVARRRFRETGFRFGVDGTRSRLRARVGTHRAAVRAAGGEVCVERRDASGRGAGHDSCGAWGLAKRGDVVTRGEDNNALRGAGICLRPVRGKRRPSRTDTHTRARTVPNLDSRETEKKIERGGVRSFPPASGSRAASRGRRARSLGDDAVTEARERRDALRRHGPSRGGLTARAFYYSTRYRK